LAKRLDKGQFARLWDRADGPALKLTLSELALFLEGCDLVGKKRLSPPALNDKDLEPRSPM
jgi:transposase